MITGVHTILYSVEPDKDRAFFRDILGLKSVDSGGGWLIFALPPGELGVHPTDEEAGKHEMYLICDNVERTIGELQSRGVECSPIHEASWGRLTMIVLPGGSKLGIYEARHVTAIGA